MTSADSTSSVIGYPSSSLMLHPQLLADTHHVKDLALCRVLLMDDARFCWLILAPMRENMREIFELPAADQAQLMHEISAAAKALKLYTHAEKINVAALGNVVPQLHVHIIARHKHDCAWPQPVWNARQQRTLYEDVARDTLLADLGGIL